MDETYQEVTCVKIHSHNNIIKVGIKVEMGEEREDKKFLYVMAGEALDIDHDALKNSIKSRFPEVGFIDEILGEGANRIVDCVRINSMADIFRIRVAATLVRLHPIILVIPAEVPFGENLAIRTIIEEEFPYFQVMELGCEESKSNNFIAGVGMVGVVLGMAGIAVASVVSIVRSLKKFVRILGTKDFSALANVNVSPKITVKAAIWNSNSDVKSRTQ